MEECEDLVLRLLEIVGVVYRAFAVRYKRVFAGARDGFVLLRVFDYGWRRYEVERQMVVGASVAFGINDGRWGGEVE